jgi:hypothetical protein
VCSSDLAWDWINFQGTGIPPPPPPPPPTPSPPNSHCCQIITDIWGSPYALYNSGGRNIARNSSGALYVTFYDTDYTQNRYEYGLSWSTDGGETWQTQYFLPTVGDTIYRGPELAIDSSDTVHLIYIIRGTGWHYIPYDDFGYRNFTLASGFGDEIRLNTGRYPFEYSSTIDSQDRIHLVWDAASEAGYSISYMNISPLAGIGAVTNITVDIIPWNPLIEVDPSDTVHIIWGEDNIPGGINTESNLQYVNFSSGGWGAITRMIDTSQYQIPQKFITGYDGKFQILFLDGSVNSIFYTNTSADTNFQLSSSMAIGIDATGGTVATDLDGTIHFIYMLFQVGGWRMGYRSLTDAGLNSETIIYPDGTTYFPKTLWGLNPPGNIPENTAKFVAVVYDSTSLNTTLRFGEFSYPPVPAPTPANPFTSVTMESTAQTIQMVIMVGLLLLLLASIALLILGHMPNE